MKSKIVISGILIALSILLTGQNAFSQGGYINSVSFIPPVPTQLDNIKVVGSITLTSGPCPLMNISCYQNGNTIEVNAYHCYGMLSVMCDNSDTCQLGPLSPGTYNVNFHLWTGPCPNPSSFTNPDSYTKTLIVTVVSGVSENMQRAGLIYPNPNSGRCMVSNLGEDGELLIFSIDGRLLGKYVLPAGKNELVLDLAQGIYMAVFRNSGYYSSAAPLVIIR